MDPVKITIFGLPGLLLLWLLTLVAFGVFGYRMWQLVGLLRQGRYEDRFDQLGRRIGHVITHVLLQPRIFNERSIGLPHFLIFWGFVLYVVCFNWGLVRGLFPGLQVPYPDEVGVAALFLDVFAVAVLASLVVAVVRRSFFAPPHLHLSMDANLILSMIGILMLSSLFGGAFRLVGTRSNRSAIGAEVTVEFGAEKQRRVVDGGMGFASQNDRRLHFGLGRQMSVSRVTIRWPSGDVQTLGRFAADQMHVVTEPGAGR